MAQICAVSRQREKTVEGDRNCRSADPQQTSAARRLMGRARSLQTVRFRAPIRGRAQGVGRFTESPLRVTSVRQGRREQWLTAM